MYSITINVKTAEELIEVAKALGNNLIDDNVNTTEVKEKKPRKVKETKFENVTVTEPVDETKAEYPVNKVTYDDVKDATLALAAIHRSHALDILAKFKSSKSELPCKLATEIKEEDYVSFIEKAQNKIKELKKEVLA